MKNVRRKKWYGEGLRFQCQRCGACCTGRPGYVWVVRDEAERIARFLGLPPREFATQYLREAGSHDSLVELPDGRCVFYTDKACSIYPVRPVQCHTFPFWRSIIASRESWERCRQKCPGAGKGRLYSPAEIEEIARLSAAESGSPELHLP